MAAIILPDRWKRQPHGAVELDWGNPLTKNLLGAGYANSPNLVTGEILTRSGAADIGVGKPGVATATTSTGYWRANINVPATNVSAFCIAEATGAKNGEGIFLSAPYTSPSPFYLGSDYDILNALAVETHYGQKVSISASVYAGQPIAAGFSVTGAWGALKLYKNGVEYSGSAGGFAASTTLNIAENKAKVYMWAIWSRLLPAMDFSSISDNPWQIFKPRKRILYFDAPSFPVLSSLTASYITSSGGRLTAST